MKLLLSGWHSTPKLKSVITIILSFLLTQTVAQQLDETHLDSLTNISSLDSLGNPVLKVSDLAQNKTDSILNKLDSIPAQPLSKADSLLDRLESPTDSIESKINSLQTSIQQKIDSLKAKGLSTAKWENRLDSVKQLANLPQEKINQFNSLEQKWKKELANKIPMSDSLKGVQDRVKNKLSEVNEVSTRLGVGPLGKDVMPQSPINGMPGTGDIAPDINIPGASGSLPTIPKGETPSVPTAEVPGLEKPKIDAGPLGDIKEKAGEIKKITSEVGGISKEAKEYSGEIKTIKEEGFSKSEKLPELMEEQAGRIEEVAVFQQQEAKMTKEMKEREELIKKYKEEKAIKEELEKRSKELAGDVAMDKMKETELPKKMGKYKRKFSQVQDMRNLPKRAPNPMKGLGWRERVVPGFVLHTLSSQQVWLDFSPQAYYKLTGHWLFGAGATYRMSFNPNRITFDDFGALYGMKLFTQFNAFKGFFVRAEAEQLDWKPWKYQLTDPDFRESVYTAAVGLGKAYNITKKLKGNVQTLYHVAWNGSDPYKNKIIIRFGIDFSLKRKEKKPWDDKIKQK